MPPAGLSKVTQRDPGQYKNLAYTASVASPSVASRLRPDKSSERLREEAENLRKIGIRLQKQATKLSAQSAAFQKRIEQQHSDYPIQRTVKKCCLVPIVAIDAETSLGR